MTGGIVLLDQLTKQQIMQTMRLHESIPVIPNLFSLTYIRNP
ncbi:MAG: signal peptidase II, partial [Nitrospira sp.]